MPKPLKAPQAQCLRGFFVFSVRQSALIEALRTRSATLLEQVTEVVLEEAVQEMQKDFQAKLTSELKTPKNFWRAVGENVVANLVSAGLVTLAIVLFYLSQVDVVPTVGKALGYEVTPKSQK